MMKRLIPLSGLLLCACLTFASIVDDPETIDGYLTSGEYPGGVLLEGSEKLVVDGGNAAYIDTEDFSRLEIISTSLPLSLEGKRGVYDIHMGDNSSLLFIGGATESIKIGGNATADLKGGIINYVTIGRAPSDICEVTIYCQTGYVMNQVGISGLWGDGTPFDIQFDNIGGPYPLTFNFVNVVIVPEPTTLMILGLGVILLRRQVQ